MAEGGIGSRWSWGSFGFEGQPAGFGQFHGDSVCDNAVRNCHALGEEHALLSLQKLTQNPWEGADLQRCSLRSPLLERKRKIFPVLPNLSRSFPEPAAVIHLAGSLFHSLSLRMLS